MEREGIPIYKMLASYIYAYNVSRMEKFLNKLEEKRPKGFGLAMLRKSEPLLVNDEYYDILGPEVYWYLMLIYRRIGEKEDLRRLWNLAKDRKVLDTIGQYSRRIEVFWFNDDIEGVHEVLEEWYSGEHHRILEIKTKDILEFDHYRKLAIQDTKSKVNDMLEDHKEEEERKKTGMEVRQNGWDPNKNLALSAYACVQYVEGRTDIESAVDVLRLLGKREPQDAIKPIMDKDQLGRKMVEAMRGGGYVGEV
ncbi:PREDICTED: pentatricopeptide repeat-containing protein At2g20710, mitochondrial-like [Camelina sativa]|uniref:Pentatricopeptide repeat-containing protein At2g20710, mitochondrial-like n=1 Tax=Camelina sativa TaxID=90675 RepID=A0ABM0TTM5_CAMSA|nr:PREDICTED: pentatricopeptide repeat-containing protein At2g20710, mitochondrial-like [Camelina sativa]